jgi:L-cystine uptake protein TcyP (sodium:dicarboxylate symporter family)
MLGKQTENVLTDVGQINNIVLTGMNSVSVLTPYIVFVCVLNMIISGINIPTTLLLKIFLLVWGVEFLVQIYFTLRLAYTGHVSPGLIFKKLLPTYVIAFSHRFFRSGV